MNPTPLSRLYNCVTTSLFSFSLTASLLSLSLFLSLSRMTVIAYLFWATLAYKARNSTGGSYPFTTVSFYMTKNMKHAN